MSLDTASMVRMANAVRALSMDAVQAANSGHPGMPMGMADVATVLWGEYLKHDPKAPDWAAQGGDVEQCSTALGSNPAACNCLSCLLQQQRNFFSLCFFRPMSIAMIVDDPSPFVFAQLIYF